MIKLSSINQRVLENIHINNILKGSKFKFEVLDQVNKNDLVVLATKEETKENRLLYIRNGKILETLSM